MYFANLKTLLASSYIGFTTVQTFYGFSLQGPGFNLRTVHLRFVIDGLIK
jgi:hypothetical protein